MMISLLFQSYAMKNGIESLSLICVEVPNFFSGREGNSHYSSDRIILHFELIKLCFIFRPQLWSLELWLVQKIGFWIDGHNLPKNGAFFHSLEMDLQSILHILFQLNFFMEIAIVMNYNFFPITNTNFIMPVNYIR